MAASYLDPLERAWERTRHILLRPFGAEKWIVIAFAAFLAGLAGTSFGFQRTWRFDLRPDLGHVLHAPGDGLYDVLRGTLWFMFGVPFVFPALVLGIGLLWVSSRGKFVFLDDMVRGRAAIVEPWKTHARLGHSLFLWRVGFYLAVLLLLVIVASPVAVMGQALGGSDLGRPFGALAVLAAGLGTLTVTLVGGYVALFLESFVVPIMYRRDITASEAWHVLLPLLKHHPLDFLLYGALVAVAFVGVALGLVAATFLTCCVVPLLLSIPYLSSVVLLPITGLFRLYTLEFLAQYGAEFAVPAPPDGDGVVEHPPIEPR